MARSGARTIVGSVAVLLAALVSPPPETVAVLVTLAGALAATFTLSMMGGYEAPALSASARVQVVVASVQVQPLPAIAAAVSPAGSVSVTVTVPVLDAVPTLVTAMV